METIWARIVREAGARVQTNVMLRDVGLPTGRARDGRRLEIVATGLPLYRGTPLGIDATLVAPLKADGHPAHEADRRDGAAIANIEGQKRRRYPELVDSGVLRLVVVAAEIGGRLSETSADLLRHLATAKARSAPPLARQTARSGWLRRWSQMVAVCIQDATAATLVDDVDAALDGVDGECPATADVCAEFGRP